MQNRHTDQILLPFEYHHFTVLVKTVEAAIAESESEDKCGDAGDGAVEADGAEMGTHYLPR